MKLGKTGDFPEGKLNPTDEGGLQIAIGIEDGKVRIDFGTPTAWIAMSPDQAMTFAMSIINKAERLLKVSHGRA